MCPERRPRPLPAALPPPLGSEPPPSAPPPLGSEPFALPQPLGPEPSALPPPLGSEPPPSAPPPRASEVPPPLAQAPAVRVGLSCVLGLAEATARRIIAARAERPFESFADFADRARPALPEAEALILAGALDWTGRTRPSLLLEARVTDARQRGTRPPARAADASLLPRAVAPLAVPELPAFDLAEQVRGECRASGLWFSAHPLDVLVDPAELMCATPAAALAARVGRRVTLVGMPCATRRVETKQGGAMLFLTLADRSGLAECVLFPDAYRALAHALRGQVVRVAGRVEETLGAVTITVSKAAEVAAPAVPFTGAPCGTTH